MDQIQLLNQLQTIAEGEDVASSLSALYHENSKQAPCDIAFYKRVQYFNTSPLGAEMVRRAGKHYACADHVVLPEPALPATALTEAIAARRSVRRFTGRPLPLAQLALLLRYGGGVIETVPGHDHLFRRAIPSGGGLYPTEIYVLPLDVEGLGEGAYHYNPLDHVLARIHVDPGEPVVTQACQPDLFVGSASAALVLTSSFERQRVKYGERAYRFSLLEAGHLAQNLLLLIAAAGLGAVPIGGFLDDALNDYLRIDGRSEATVYLILIGSV